MEGTQLLAAYVLFEKKEEEEILLYNVKSNENPNSLIRQEEGFQDILIQRHRDIFFKIKLCLESFSVLT